MAILSNIRSLARSTDIVFLQETNLPVHDCHYLTTAFPTHKVFYNNCPIAATAGTVFMVSHSLLKHYKATIDVRTLGYSQILTLSPRTLGSDSLRNPGPSVSPNTVTSPPSLLLHITVFGLYLPHDAKLRTSILSQVASFRSASPSGCIPCKFLLGDLNFVENAEDSTGSSSYYGISTQLRKAFSAVLSVHSLSEVHQPAFTFHRRTTSNSGKITRLASRLDRIYTSLPEAVYDLATPTADIPPLPYKAFIDYDRKMATDHLPVRCRFFPTPNGSAKGSRLPSCPKWILAAPEFRGAFDAQWARHYDLRDPVAKLAAFKASIRKACSVAVTNASRRLKAPPLTITYGRKLLSALAGGKPELSTVRKLLKLAPQWSPYVQWMPGQETFRYEGLVTKLSSMYRRIADPLALVTTDTPHGWSGVASPFMGGPRKNSFGAFRVRSKASSGASLRVHPLKRLARALPSTRQVLTHLVSEKTQESICDPEGMALEAKRYWGKIWGDSVPFNHAATYRWLKGYTKQLDTSLMAPRATPPIMESIIRATNNSAAGPDGIPFGAYRVLLRESAETLSAFINALGNGHARPPLDFNHSLLHLLVKKCTGRIADTRPISVPNASNRLVSLFFTGELSRAMAAAFLHPAQRAGLPGRQIADNVREVNEWYSERVAKGVTGFLLFVDFSKAFDSMSHQYLLTILAHVGCPPFYVRLYTALLTNMAAVPVFGGRTYSAKIGVARGIKQGGPASPLLFCLAMDPLLEKLDATTSTGPQLRPSQLHPQGVRTPSSVLGGFMDDVGVGFEDIHLIQPISLLFLDFQGVAGLKVNLDKTMLIPTQDLTDNQRQVIHASRWPNLPVQDSGKYLGVKMGRAVTVDAIFAAALAKFESRLAGYLTRKGSFSVCKRVLIANVFLTPIFSYLSQFYVIPPATLKAIHAGLRRWLAPLGQSAYPVTALSRPLALLGLARPLLLPEIQNLAVLGKMWPWAVGTGVHGSCRSTRIVCQVQWARGQLLARGVSVRALVAKEHVITPKLIRSAMYTSALARQAARDRIAHCMKNAGLPLLPRRVLRAWQLLPTVGNPTVRFHYFAFFSNALAVKYRRVDSILRRKKRARGAPLFSKEDLCSFCGVGIEDRRHALCDCTAVRRALWQISDALVWDWPRDLSWLEVHLIFASHPKRLLTKMATFVVTLVAAIWRALMASWTLPESDQTVQKSAGRIVRHFVDVVADCGTRWRRTLIGNRDLQDFSQAMPPASLMLALPPQKPQPDSVTLVDCSSTAESSPPLPAVSSSSTGGDSQPTGHRIWPYQAILKKRLTKAAVRRRRNRPFGRKRRRRKYLPGGDYEFLILWDDVGTKTWEPFRLLPADDHTLWALLEVKPGGRGPRHSILEEAKMGRLRRPPDPNSQFNYNFNTSVN